MIIDFITHTFFGAINFILNLLPKVTALPFGLDSVFSSGVGYFRAFIGVFPPFGVFLEVFLWYLLFKLSIMGLNLILGHRSPTKHV